MNSLCLVRPGPLILRQLVPYAIDTALKRYVPLFLQPLTLTDFNYNTTYIHNIAPSFYKTLNTVSSLNSP